MARCGCSGKCSCVVEGVQPYIKVEGNGTGTHPYKVIGTPGYEAAEGQCIQVELTGDGSQVNPLVIGAVPIIDPDATNTIECREAGLFSEATAIDVEDSPCIDMEIAGSGTQADPYIIGAAPIIDPDPENILECRDDGLFAQGTAIGVDDTNCINLEANGAGTGADPMVITARPIVHPAGNNLLSCTSQGLRVTPCVDDGDCLHLDVDANGCITGNVRVSPDDCNEIECRNNGLWAPEQMTSQGFTPPAGHIAAGTTLGTNQQACSPMTNHVINNPSDCLPLAVHLQFGLTAQMEVGPDAQPQVEYLRVIDGTPSPPIVIRTGARNYMGASYRWSDDMERDFFNIVIPPGGSAIYRARVCITNVGGGTITMLGGGASIRHWGGTS